MLDRALSESTDEERTKVLLRIQNELGKPKTLKNNILVSLVLLFVLWWEMMNLSESYSESLKSDVSKVTIG